MAPIRRAEETALFFFWLAGYCFLMGAITSLFNLPAIAKIAITIGYWSYYFSNLLEKVEA